jgi:hypothetical protein
MLKSPGAGYMLLVPGLSEVPKAVKMTVNVKRGIIGVNEHLQRR